MTPGYHWTTPMLNALRCMYPKADWPELLASFPGKSRMAIYKMAKKLGVKRDQRAYRLRMREIFFYRGESVMKLSEKLRNTGHAHMAAEAEALEKDAERYQWLRALDCDMDEARRRCILYDGASPDELDALIDDDISGPASRE